MCLYINVSQIVRGCGRWLIIMIVVVVAVVFSVQGAYQKNTGKKKFKEGSLKETLFL